MRAHCVRTIMDHGVTQFCLVEASVEGVEQQSVRRNSVTAVNNNRVEHAGTGKVNQPTTQCTRRSCNNQTTIGQQCAHLHAASGNGPMCNCPQGGVIVFCSGDKTRFRHSRPLSLSLCVCCNVYLPLVWRLREEVRQWRRRPCISIVNWFVHIGLPQHRAFVPLPGVSSHHGLMLPLPR